MMIWRWRLGPRPSFKSLRRLRQRLSPAPIELNMPDSFELIFRREGAEAARAKFLSRLFGIFAEEVVRLWSSDERCPYASLGRPTLTPVGSSRGYTLDFTLQDRSTGKVYVAEMKCEIEYQNFRYFALEGAWQIEHHNKPAFKAFLDAASGTSEQRVAVNGRPVKADGAILIWGSVTEAGCNAVVSTFGLHDVLSVASICQDLVAWHHQEYADLLAKRKTWTAELFDGLMAIQQQPLTLRAEPA